MSDGELSKWMELAAAADEAGNNDEAYRYYTKAVETDPSSADAWLGKAFAAGWGSGLRSDRFGELVSGVDRALKLAEPKNHAAMAQAAALEIASIVQAFVRLSKKHTAEYISLDDTWDEHVARCTAAVAAMSKAHSLAPNDQSIMRDIVALAKSMIEGVSYEDEYATDGDKYKTKHLSPRLEAEITSVMNEMVGKLQALDPNYQAPKIEKAGEMSAGMAIGCLVVLVLAGFVVWWLYHKVMG